jgi:hypothetical protein
MMWLLRTLYSSPKKSPEHVQGFFDFSDLPIQKYNRQMATNS